VVIGGEAASKGAGWQPYWTLMARPARLMRDSLLPKLQQLYKGRAVPYQQVDDAENNNNIYTNNNYSNVNNNLLELPSSSSPTVRRWQRWSRNIVGLNCLFIPTPRRYMAVPRTPVLSDRLETEAAAATYRARREQAGPQPADGGGAGRGACIASSSGDAGSSYRPFEQLVLPA